MYVYISKLIIIHLKYLQRLLLPKSCRNIRERIAPDGTKSKHLHRDSKIESHYYLKARNFHGNRSSRIFYGHFAGINFRQLSFTKDFAGINLRTLSLTKDFMGINIREHNLYKYFEGIDFASTLRKIFSTTLV